MRFASIQCSKMRLRPGLRSGPHWGAYSAPPDPLAGFKGPLRGEEEGKVGEEKGKGEGQGGRGRGGKVDSDAQLEQGRRLADPSISDNFELLNKIRKKYSYLYHKCCTGTYLRTFAGFLVT